MRLNLERRPQLPLTGLNVLVVEPVQSVEAGVMGDKQSWRARQRYAAKG